MAADEITYADKEQNEESLLPEVKKFTFSNANEIKTVAKNHADLLDGLETDKLDDAPNDGSTYARESGAWVAFTKFLSSAVNNVTSSFGIKNGQYGITINSFSSLWGKTNGDTAYWETLFTSGKQRMKFWTNQSTTPETGDDQSQNINPSSDPNNLIPLKYVQPAKLTITTATASLTSSNLNNQFIDYTGSGGNITIESSFLNVDQEACISQGGTDQFSLVAGSGVTLEAPDGLLTSRVQYSSIGIYKISSTIYRITGDLA